MYESIGYYELSTSAEQAPASTNGAVCQDDKLMGGCLCDDVFLLKKGRNPAWCSDDGMGPDAREHQRHKTLTTYQDGWLCDGQDRRNGSQVALPASLGFVGRVMCNTCVSRAINKAWNLPDHVAIRP